MIDLTGLDSDDEPAPPQRAPKRTAGQIDLTADSDEDDAPRKAARTAVVDVDSDAALAAALAREEGTFPAPAPPPAPKAAKADAKPPWDKKVGMARLYAEFKALRKWEGSPRVYDATMVHDRADCWRFKVKDFDDDCEGGRDLNKDLRELGRKKRQDHIVMELTFPSDYPTRPFFLRCVSPRFKWYTGHVTAGGAICIEALTTDGSANQWRPTHCVEAILNTVFTNMLHVEPTVVRTATGPGGRAGPLRVDLKQEYGRPVLQEYSMGEAKSAFDRMLGHHRANGW